MKKKYLIIVIVLMIFAVGCNNKESTAFKEGQTALENHEYDKAKKYLSDVLEQDSKNESARCMYIQATKMSKAEYYKNKGLYDKSLDNLDGLVNLENGIKYSYLSERAGMPMNILSRTLNGKRKMSAEEYFMICEILGLPAETFAPDKKVGKQSE